MNGAARTETAKPGKLLLLVAGFLLWSSAFVVLYGLQGLGCRLGWDEAALLGPVSLNRGVLLAAWAVHVVLVGALAAVQARRHSAGRGAPFVDRAGLALTFSALVATIWTGIPILISGSTCS
ncbi:hypothetical protein IGS68_16945 [Skermanella sp. TT6]|uniref:Uncharacterized protein n=1 Tax=Skermanella cutis TaxID=2775420 RepID=A0ABX7B0B2_9PROT|nr:hypothetical protein [Skermanella sp. TT6]QQP87770.1 hypothetical protein IGS68_16945 [Skermanella sp. TT6]